MTKTEAIRRQRLSDHYKYLRGRYPNGLPDADDGREDLYELLLAISLATFCYRKMKRAIEIWAGWMGDDEAEQLIDRVNQTPDYERKRTKQKLGEIWGLTYEERQAWGIRTVAPSDISEGEFLRRRKERKNFLQYKRRRDAGKLTRAEWLEANSKSRTKPWELAGKGRTKWYQERRTGVVPIKLSTGSVIPVRQSKSLGGRKRTGEQGRVRKKKSKAA